MSRHELSEEKLEAGRECLELLDEYGLGVQGAVWIYIDGLKEWRFYIVTSLIDIDGLVETFNRIEKLLGLRFNNPNLSIDDLHLGSPNDLMFSTMANVIAAKGTSLIELENVLIQNERARVLIEHAYVYRLDKAPPLIKAKQARQLFDRKLRALERADSHQSG
jgi:hypothetical protein